MEVGVRELKANLSIRPEQPPNVLPTELRSDVSLIFDAVGPVDEVTLPSFSAGAELETTRLGVEEAAKTLLNQTMNMKRIREAGLRAMYELAARTPVTSIVHSHSVTLAAALIDSEGQGVVTAGRATVVRGVVTSGRGMVPPR